MAGTMGGRRLAGEEGELQGGTRVLWRFSKCGKSNIENHIEN